MTARALTASPSLRDAYGPGRDDLIAAIRSTAQWPADPMASDTDGIRLVEGVSKSHILTHPMLWSAARCVASGMRAHGIQPGDRLLFLLPTCEAYVVATCAAILLGAVPCTVATPTTRANLEHSWGYLRAIQQKLEPALIITSEQLLPLLQANPVMMQHIVTVDQLLATTPIELDDLPALDETHPHHIQLTSGSTSMPKGVVLSHGNVRAHLAALEQAISYHRTTDRLVSWLPLYHDMGLVQLLSAIYYQSSIVLMTPFSFLRNPLSWLQCISMYSGTIAAAPTFAYSLCVKKFNPDKLADVRLSQWRLAFVGAEPVPWSIVDAFQQCYQPYGLSDSTLFPCYGMAETVLATTLPQRGSFPNRRTGFLSCDRIDATLLRHQGHAVPAPATQDADVTPLEVLGMGQPISGLEVCIQNGDGQILGERVVGEICVCGSSLMSGYFHDPEATAQAVRNGWYHTGDRGYMADGELYVLGRIKELIIVRGRNYQPHDIEAVVEQHSAVRKSYCVAFSVYNDAIGTDDVVCVAETNTDSDLFPGIIQEIQASLQAACGFTAHAIVLVRHGTLPRTTSGKPQRLLTREWYREGKLTPSADPIDADRQ